MVSMVSSIPDNLRFGLMKEATHAKLSRETILYGTCMGTIYIYILFPYTKLPN